MALLAALALGGDVSHTFGEVSHRGRIQGYGPSDFTAGMTFSTRLSKLYAGDDDEPSRAEKRDDPVATTTMSSFGITTINCK